MKLKCILIVACSLFTLTGQADEGMWMLGNLNKQTRKNSACKCLPINYIIRRNRR